MKFINTSVFKNIRNICYSITTFSSIVPVINTTVNKGWKYRYGLYVGVPTLIALPFLHHSSVKYSTLCNGLDKVELGYISEFNEGDSKQVKVHNGKDTVLVTNVKGRFYITGSSCPHFLASFADGAITDELLVCPWHNAKFELKDGSCVNEEIIGTSCEAPESVTVVENVSDVESLNFPDDTKLFYVTQTTLSLDDCKHIKQALVTKYPHIETIPSGSICYATTNRQTAVHKVTKLVDMVLIVGSKLSSNAKRLVEAALNRDVKSYLIFDANDITEELVGSARNIALSSSASTPEDLTNSVMNKLSSPPYNFVVEEFDGAVERVPNWRLPRYHYVQLQSYRNLEMMIKDHDGSV